jgi:hypothetical protein
MLLNPSAGTEQVWLYAAGLDEHLLAPHTLNQSFAVRNAWRREWPGAQLKTRRSAENTNRLRAKLTDAFKH